MRTELLRIIHSKNFFELISSSNNHVTYNFKKPTKVLLNNIYINWLKAISTKSTKNFPVFINNNFKSYKNNSSPFGTISPCIHDHHKVSPLEHCLSQYAPEKTTNLHLNLLVPKQDAMQYFIQWQRLRKYWWSSITTTPSLFTINEVKYKDDAADVDIVAQYPWGPELVETVTLNTKEDAKNMLHISCSTTLEGALFILLLDGQNNSSKTHLRLHRKMTPYKISFALDYTDIDNKETMNELAILLYNMLEREKISTWLPDFALSMESQIKENLLMGVAYTAVISEGTLANGIMHLLNSNTTLKEQIHIADLNSYAAMLFQK